MNIIIKAINNINISILFVTKIHIHIYIPYDADTQILIETWLSSIYISSFLSNVLGPQTSFQSQKKTFHKYP